MVVCAAAEAHTPVAAVLTVVRGAIMEHQAVVAVVVVEQQCGTTLTAAAALVHTQARAAALHGTTDYKAQTQS
jgi:hypothetical protein